jgi:predicted transcriptional regulator
MKVKAISELEQQIMNIVWEKDGCCVKEVLAEMQKKKDIQYTTVLTILQRLYEKGLIEKEETKKAFIYKAKVSKHDYSKMMVKDFVHKLVNSFGDVAIASFAEGIDSLSKQKREKLVKLLEEYEKNK